MSHGELPMVYNRIMKSMTVVIALEDVQKEKFWIEEQIAQISDETIKKLVAAARDVRQNAYAPYSNYHVGAAVLGVSGNIYIGCNTEVVSYSETSHAEQNAVTGAICAGEVKRNGRKFIRAVAVVHTDTSAPCGHCRQILVEHCDNALIVLANEKGEVHTVTSLRFLLPLAFTPTALNIS